MHDPAKSASHALRVLTYPDLNSLAYDCACGRRYGSSSKMKSSMHELDALETEALAHEFPEYANEYFEGLGYQFESGQFQVRALRGRAVNLRTLVRCVCVNLKTLGN